MIISFLITAVVTVSAQPIYGMAVAADGDSLRIGENRVRLFGIDAPEFDQFCTRHGGEWPCGRESAQQLAALVTGREIRCVPLGTDAYDRTLARCSVGGMDVNRVMVAKGYAVAFRKYSSDYVSAEERAKAAKRGMWAGSFEMPSEVRAASAPEPRPSRLEQPVRRSSARRAPPSSANGGCVIKGNHSRRGDWIYHLPGMPYYERTRPEAMFCTEAEAQAAGYRRAIVR